MAEADLLIDEHTSHCVVVVVDEHQRGLQVDAARALVDFLEVDEVCAGVVLHDVEATPGSGG